ncbi:hypothetical protein [Bradyrhizobium sp. dw_78]|uniref:hypothetical protein n=1 Tax=Bradyrhizobium sp. dw_78 TaxID=2719793 RepID=UPI001BD54EB9|nr:hypothetical protein [Bradyrhizobium sp. dw_78]
MAGALTGLFDGTIRLQNSIAYFHMMKRRALWPKISARDVPIRALLSENRRPTLLFVALVDALGNTEVMAAQDFDSRRNERDDGAPNHEDRQCK